MTTAQQALGTLDRGDRELGSLLAKLGPADMLATGIGGGEWSPKDLLGHLALWHEIALRTMDERAAGAEPWIVGVFASPGPGPNDAELVARAPWGLDRARRAYEDSLEAVREAIVRLPESDWTGPVARWSEDPPTLGGLLGVVLGMDGLPFGHAVAHLDDLRSFVEARGRAH